MAKTKQPDPDATVGKAHPPAAEPGMTEADMKAWVRREIHLVANGASISEREALNP